MIVLHFFTIISMLLAPQLFSAPAAAENNEGVVAQGISLYHSNQLKEAETLLKTGLDSDPNNPLILYNLGLVEMKLNKNTMALALWRRAIAQAPSFREARYALSQLVASTAYSDPISGSTYEWVREHILTYLSMDECLGLLIFFGLPFGVLFLRHLGARRRAILQDAAVNSPGALLILCCGLFVVALTLTGLRFFESTFTRATIIAAKVEAKSAPSPDAAPLFDMSEGTDVVVRKIQDGWAQIEWGSDRIGWAARDQLFITSGGD